MPAIAEEFVKAALLLVGAQGASVLPQGRSVRPRGPQGSTWTQRRQTSRVSPARQITGEGSINHHGRCQELRCRSNLPSIATAFTLSRQSLRLLRQLGYEGLLRKLLAYRQQP